MAQAVLGPSGFSPSCRTHLERIFAAARGIRRRARFGSETGRFQAACVPETGHLAEDLDAPHRRASSNAPRSEACRYPMSASIPAKSTTAARF